MADQFVSTRCGAKINVAYIRCVHSVQRHSPSGKPWSGHLIETDDGKRHEVDGWVDTDQFNNVILPAGPWALTLTTILLGGAEDDAPLIERWPIIGWVIGPLGWPMPLAPGVDGVSEADSESRAMSYFIELPNGHYQHAIYGGSRFDTLEECVAEVRRQLREKAHG
jgi:hypothetical protein